jgi:DNA mismatch repair protein MSH3
MYSNVLHIRNSPGGANIRIERFEGRMSYTDAFSFASEYYTDKTKYTAASENFKSGSKIFEGMRMRLITLLSGKLMATIIGFPQRVVIVLAHAMKHLSEFSIADAFMETNFFSRFTTKAHMLLNGNTVTNLYAPN